jgi:hypothetical protein
MSLTLTTYDALLKRRYTSAKVQNLTEAERPLMARLKKDPSFSGSAMSVPLIHANPQGVASQSLSIAQAASSNLKSKNFLITVGDYFGTVDISAKVMVASRDNPGAFLSSKTAETDGLYEQMADNLHILAWGNGGGAIGRRASATGSTVVTLTDPTTIYAFEEGMQVVASSDGDGSAGTEALKSGVGTVTVVDRVNGKFTYTGTITSAADNDYFFRYGDFLGNTGAGLLSGVQAFVYSTDTSVPNLFGMVRTSDPTRLAGCRIASGDLTGRNMEERIKLLGSRMTGRYKAKMFTDGFMNPEDWQTLEIQLNARGIRSTEDDKTQFGFNVLKVGTGGAMVTIYADRACPKGTFFGLRMENWTLYSMLDLIHPVEGDGLTMLRKSTTNDFEFRLESFPQLCTNAPLYQGRVPLP